MLGMFRQLIIGSMLLAGSFQLRAQDVLFDDPHPTDGAVFLKTVDGQQRLVNLTGEPIPTHEAFRMSDQEKRQSPIFGVVNGRTDDRNEIIGPTFNLLFVDVANNTNQGFDDPISGQQRRSALEAAFAYYASVIQDEGVMDVEIRQSFSGNPTSNPFAFSASYYFGSKGFNDSFTKDHIVSGDDPYDAYADGYIQFNFHTNMNYNLVTAADPAPDQYDFHTVALHEIMHLLGFTSYTTEDGTSAAATYVFTAFDEFLADYNKDQLLIPSGSGSSTVIPAPSTSTLTNNQVWFELFPSQHAPVFSPGSFNGSSIDHFDNSRSSDGSYVMHPSLSRGQAFKMLHEDEVRVLERLGYTVNYSVATAIEDGFGEDAPVRYTSGLYPNPAYGYDPIKIDVNDLNGPEVLVIVYDMHGRQAYSKVILNQGPGPVTAIDPHHNLAPGMYIVVGSSRDELFNEKLVIK